MSPRVGIASAAGGVALGAAVVACVVDDVQGADIASLLAAVAAACLVYDARRYTARTDDWRHAAFVAAQAIIYVTLVAALVVIAFWLPRQSLLLPTTVAGFAAIIQLVAAATTMCRAIVRRRSCHSHAIRSTPIP